MNYKQKRIVQYLKDRKGEWVWNKDLAFYSGYSPISVAKYLHCYCHDCIETKYENIHDGMRTQICTFYKWIGD